MDPALLSNDSFSYSWLINVKHSALDALDDAAEGDPFIEIDPWLASSLRRASADDAGSGREFDFGFPGSPSPTSTVVLAPADQIFSDGLILPLHLVSPPRDQEARRSRDSSDPGLGRSLSLDSARIILSLSNRFKSSSSPPLRFLSAQGSWPAQPDRSRKTTTAPPSRRPTGRCRLPPLLGSCCRASGKILRKYLYCCFLIPLYKKMESKLVWRAEGSSAVVSSLPAGSSAASSSSASPRISGEAALPAGIDHRRFTGVLDTGMEKAIHEAVLYCKRSVGHGRTLSFGAPVDEQQSSCSSSLLCGQLKSS